MKRYGRAPEGDSRTFFTWPVFCRIYENLLDLFFGNKVLVDVRSICSRIDEEANVHGPDSPKPQAANTALIMS